MNRESFINFLESMPRDLSMVVELQEKTRKIVCLSRTSQDKQALLLVTGTAGVKDFGNIITAGDILSVLNTNSELTKIYLADPCNSYRKIYDIAKKYTIKKYPFQSEEDNRKSIVFDLIYDYYAKVYFATGELLATLGKFDTESTASKTAEKYIRHDFEKMNLAARCEQYEREDYFYEIVGL